MNELFIFIVIKLFIIYREWVIFPINLIHRLYHVSLLLKSIPYPLREDREKIIFLTAHHTTAPVLALPVFSNCSFSHISAPLAFFLFLDKPHFYLMS